MDGLAAGVIAHAGTLAAVDARTVGGKVYIEKVRLFTKSSEYELGR
jgi:hypothetical protein